MCREMEIMRNQAHEEGVEIGIKKGRMLQLIKQVCAKMQKFSSAEEIANDLVEQDVPLIQKIMDYAMSIGFDLCALDFSPIKGPEGNIEYLVHLVRLPDGVTEEETNVDVDAVVKSAHDTLDK